MVLLSERFEAVSDRMRAWRPEEHADRAADTDHPHRGPHVRDRRSTAVVDRELPHPHPRRPRWGGQEPLGTRSMPARARGLPRRRRLRSAGDAQRSLRRHPSARRSGRARGEGNQAPLDVAIEHLSHARMLLLIDNFEQILEAGPDLAALLDACPGVSALVTSRRPLRLRGERLMTVEPLGLPAAIDEVGDGDSVLDTALRSSAVALFIERAQRVRPGFTIDRSNVAATADLVRRLDGLPLAIELVAARADLLEPGQMLERLERGTGVPMSAGRDFPERQRTLRATLEWSHNLLTPPQRTLLSRLGMFADGATLEAIESVCAGAPVQDLLDSLSALLDNGLIRVDRQRREGQPRFVLFLTVREFALERLQASDDARAVTARFIEWALETVARADPSQYRDAPDRWPEPPGRSRKHQAGRGTGHRLRRLPAARRNGLGHAALDVALRRHRRARPVGENAPSRPAVTRPRIPAPPRHPPACALRSRGRASSSAMALERSPHRRAWTSMR